MDLYLHYELTKIEINLKTVSFADSYDKLLQNQTFQTSALLSIFAILFFKGSSFQSIYGSMMQFATVRITSDVVLRILYYQYQTLVKQSTFPYTIIATCRALESHTRHQSVNHSHVQPYAPLVSIDIYDVGCDHMLYFHRKVVTKYLFLIMSQRIYY